MSIRFGAEILAGINQSSGGGTCTGDHDDRVVVNTAEYEKRMKDYEADKENYLDPDSGLSFIETIYYITDDYEEISGGGSKTIVVKDIKEAEEKYANGEITDGMDVFIEEDDGSEYDVSNETVEFTESEKLEELVSGETLGEHMGKIAKGLKTVSENETRIESLEGNVLTTTKSVYVNPNGDDTTGDGTQEKPWKTIQKALDECPMTFNDGIYYIYVANGVYDVSKVIYGCSIYIYAISEDANVVINGNIHVADGGTLLFEEIDSLTFNMINNVCPLYAYRTSYISFRNGNLIINNTLPSDGTPVGTGIQVADNSMFRIYGDLECNNTSAIINVMAQSKATLQGNVSGENHNYGVVSDRGSNVMLLSPESVSGILSKYEKLYEDKGGKISFFNFKSGWKLIGSVTGANSVAIDSNLYTEFKVRLRNTNYNLTYNWLITSSELTDSYEAHSNGYHSKTTYSCGAIKVCKTAISTSGFEVNDTDVLSSSTMTVYGRRA